MGGKTLDTEMGGKTLVTEMGGKKQDTMVITFFSPKNRLNTRRRSPIPEDPNEHQIPNPMNEITDKNEKLRYRKQREN